MLEQTATDSYTEFVEEVEPRLKRSLAAALGPERGLDAAAEALAYGWEHWDRIRSMKNPAGYLYRVGYRSGFKRWRQVHLPTVAVVEEPWVEPGLPAALDRLTDRQRVAVLAIHAFGWTYAETAELLGVSIGTVEKHVERGLKKLRTRLGLGDVT
jgi:DNA-directed RNA polymerase specialized sigma24 family protein